MAVDADLVDDIAAGIADIYREAELALVRLTARQINNGIARNRLAAIRDLRRGAAAIVSGLQADVQPALRDGLARAYRHGWDAAVADIPQQWFQRSRIGQAARAALSIVPGFGFVEALANALFADLGAVHNNMLRAVEDAYRTVQAAAAARILTGTQTRREASQAAWQALVDRGLTSFTDRSGRRWQLSSYVEMVGRTNAARVATTAQVDRLDTLGIDLVYVTDHVQECALCRPYEGKVLRTDPGPTGDLRVEHGIHDGVMVTVHVVDTLDGARAQGFQHPNCRHAVNAYFPGVSKLPTNTEDPEGDKARQRQRYLERRIRKAKVDEAAALTEPAKKAAAAAVRARPAALRDHLAAHPQLKRLRYREQIGAGNLPPRGQAPDPAASLGPDTQPTLDGATPPRAPAPRRPAAVDEQPVDDRTPIPGQDVIPDPPPRDLRAVPMEQLEAELMAVMSAEDDFDQDAFDLLSGEIDRREAEQRADEERRAANREKARARAERKAEQQAARMEELLDAGVPEEEAVAEVYGISVARQRRQRAINDLREQGHTGATFEALARDSYRDYLYRQWLAAENATNGYLVNAAGRAAGIDPASLFSGPEMRARKWASDELKAWWDTHGRLTFAAWRAQLLDDSSEIRRLREQGGGDFLA